MQDPLDGMAAVCRTLLDDAPPAPGYRSAPELMAEVVNGLLTEGPETLERDGAPAWSLLAVLEITTPPRGEKEWPPPAALEGATLVAVMIADQLGEQEKPVTARDVQDAVQQTEELAALLS